MFALRVRIAPILLGVAVTILPAVPSLAQAPRESAPYEYDVKAVFLYNFTRYLQWPAGNEPEVFTIVVLGASDILAPLQEIARKKTVGSKPIVVRQCAEVGQIGSPRILFIAKSAVPKLPQVLERTGGTEILTVGEVEGYGSRGVAINFVVREGAVKFEMNEKALKETRIQVGSQLLKLAILIDEGQAREAR